jgi:hypothetical protein
MTSAMPCCVSQQHRHVLPHSLIAGDRRSAATAACNTVDDQAEVLFNLSDNLQSTQTCLWGICCAVQVLLQVHRLCSRQQVTHRVHQQHPNCVHWHAMCSVQCAAKLATLASAFVGLQFKPGILCSSVTVAALSQREIPPRACL